MSFRARHPVAFSVGAIATTVLVVVLISAFFEELAERDEAAVAVIGTAHIEQILGPLEFTAIGGEIKPDLGVTAAPAIVLSVGGALRAVTDVTGMSEPRTRSVGVKGSLPESFALDPDGTMLTVADGYFGVLNRNGEIVRGVPLPYRGARLAPSVQNGTTFLFGGTQKNFRLYRFINDGTFQILLESDEPIVGATDNENAIYAATASTIMRIEPGTPHILFNIPDAGLSAPIRSLVVTDDDLVIFATDTKVYALLGSNALSIINNAGGTLRLRDRVLYVLDPRRKILFSLSPASAKLFKAIAQ